MCHIGIVIIIIIIIIILGKCGLLSWKRRASERAALRAMSGVVSTYRDVIGVYEFCQGSGGNSLTLLRLTTAERPLTCAADGTLVQQLYRPPPGWTRRSVAGRVPNQQSLFVHDCLSLTLAEL